MAWIVGQRSSGSLASARWRVCSIGAFQGMLGQMCERRGGGVMMWANMMAGPSP